MKLRSLNPLNWFRKDTTTGTSPLETAVSLLLRIGGIASNVLKAAKAQVINAEGTKQPGDVKHAVAAAALAKLFPELGPGWIGFIIQAAWLILEHTVWKEATPKEP